jgi:hypothetical protein
MISNSYNKARVCTNNIIIILFLRDGIVMNSEHVDIDSIDFEILTKIDKPDIFDIE